MNTLVSVGRGSFGSRASSALLGRIHLLRTQTTVSGDVVSQRQVQPQAGTSATKSSRPAPDSSQQETGEEKKQKPLQKPRNEAIKHDFVRLVNPETGALDPLTDIRSVLGRLDRKRQYAELVIEKPEPIVKIIDVKGMYDRAKAKHVQQVLGRAPEEKEVQLTWGVDAGDLAFKLRKVREELEDGNRVTLVFAPKKGQKIPSPEGQTKMAEEAVRLLEDIARERRERTAEKQAVALYMEALRPKQVHNLKWNYDGGEKWVGLKAVFSALRGGTRVDAVFSLPPPPKAAKRDSQLEGQVVDKVEVTKRVEETAAQLAEVAREWKARDIRKTSVILHLEAIPVAPS